MLVEKAFAKLNWLRMGASAGSSADALNYLTGCVVEERLLDTAVSDHVWRELQDLAKERGKGALLLIGCGISPYGYGHHTSPSRVSEVTDEDLDRVGLVRGNAYSLFSALEAGPEKVRLVQVQTPWSGRKESQSKFVESLAGPVLSILSKKSEAANKVVQPNLMIISTHFSLFCPQETGLQSFWIGFADFLRYFDYLEICSQTEIAANGETARLSCAASCWVPQVSAGGVLGSKSGEYNPMFEVRSWDAGKDPITLVVYQADSRVSSTIPLATSGQEKRSARPMVDIYVYVRDSSASEWELKTQLHGGPEGDRLGKIKLVNKPRYEIMITAKEPGMEGAFVLSATGKACVLSSCPPKCPDPATAKLMIRNPNFEIRERCPKLEPQDLESCLKSKKSSRIRTGSTPTSAGPSTLAKLALLCAFATLIFAGFGAFGFFGAQELGLLDFAYVPSIIFLQAGQPVRVTHTAISLLRPGTVRFSVTPPLPKGLTLNGSSGEVSGSTLQVSDGIWNVSVNNISGRLLASTSLNLKVLKVPFKYDSGLISLTIRKPFALKPSKELDTAGLKFLVSPALPAGLTLEIDGSISGSPVTVSSAQNYDVTAQSTYTQYVTNLRLEVQRNETEDRIFWKQKFEEMFYSVAGIETKLGAMREPFTFFVDRKPSVLKITGYAGSKFPDNIVFVPGATLPAGLHINKFDGTISGTPRSPASLQIWNISVLLGGESLAELEFPLQILADKQVKKTQLIVQKYEAVNLAVLSDVDCLGVRNVTIIPPLPQHLQFLIGAQCILSGKMSARSIAGKFKHLVQLYWTSGILSFELEIEVLEPLAVLEYKGVNQTYLLGEKITQKIPTNYGERRDVRFSVNPSLPRGLHLHKTLGTFYGSPSKPAEYATYTITVQNNAGESRNCSLQFEVLGHKSLQVTYENSEKSNRFFLAANESISIPLLIKPSLSWLLDSATFDVFPPLPLGLKLGQKGRIEGVPLVPQKSQMRMIRMTHPLIPDSSTFDSLVPDGHGQVHTQAIFAVVSRLKQLCYEFVDSYYVIGKAIKANKPQVDEFVGIVRFSIDAKLPAGLIFQNSTGIISGIPNEVQARTVFVVTAENTIGDQKSIRLQIEIGTKRTRPGTKGPAGTSGSLCAKETSAMQHSRGRVSSMMSESFKSARRYVF